MMVSKLAWKVLIKNESLWVRVLSGKYLKRRDFWQVSAGGASHHGSVLCRSGRVEGWDVL